MMDNLAKSEFVISRILQKLAENGIQSSLFSFDNFDFEDDSFAPFFNQAVKWLEAEGVIRMDGFSENFNGHSRLINPTLTSYGFEVLGKTLELEGTPTKLASAVKTVSEEGKNYSQIGDFFGGLLGGFTKSMGS